jgi:lipoprotein-releasing system permease protein
VVAGLGHVFLADRLGLPAGAASGVALAAGAAWALLGGAAAAVAGRRIAFYEIVAATLLLLALALGPLVILLPSLRALPLVLHAWQYQGRVVLVAGLLLVCLSSGAIGFRDRPSPSCSPGRAGSTRRSPTSSSWRGATSASRPGPSGPSSSSW